MPNTGSVTVNPGRKEADPSPFGLLACVFEEQETCARTNEGTAGGAVRHHYPRFSQVQRKYWGIH